MHQRITNKKELHLFLDSLINYEIQPALSYHKKHYNTFFVKEFLEDFHHPEKDFKVIHIAGTNGKGSLAHLLTHVLSSKGYTVGTYTSPHLVTLNERIQVNKIIIDDSSLIHLTNKLIDRLPKISTSPTFFEALTSMAILYFRDMKCDYVILETGLGGRLDSTNFATDKLSIINTIAMDHMNLLGNNIEKIALEKAGIIKQGNSIILGKQQKKIYPLFHRLSQNLGSPLYQYAKDYFVHNIRTLEGGVSFNYSDLNNPDDINGEIKIPILSIFQALNTAMTLKTLSVMKIPFTFNEINHILKDFTLPGRFQLISKSPFIILDGAHNVHAIHSLKVNLKLRFNNTRFKVLIIGIVKDKDYKTILPILLPYFDQVIISRLNFNIKKDISSDLFETSKSIHNNVQYASSFQEAFSQIKELQPKDLLVVTGSYYLVGEALTFFSNETR